MSIPLPNLYLSTTFLNLGHNRNCKPMPAHTEDIRCSWFITDTEALLWGKNWTIKLKENIGLLSHIHPATSQCSPIT